MVPRTIVEALPGDEMSRSRAGMRPTLAACFCVPAVLPSATPVDESLEAHSVRTLAHNVYLDSEFGVPQDLPKAGSTLENPYVYDATARELKSMAERGLVRIVG